MGGFLEAGGDAAELLELADAAFDEMPLGVEAFVDGMLGGARGIVGYHGERALLCYGVADLIAVIGCIGHDDRKRQGATA